MKTGVQPIPPAAAFREDSELSQSKTINRAVGSGNKDKKYNWHTVPSVWGGKAGANLILVCQ